jgi:tetratricopeptide (TPR) repeat protein
MGSQRLSAEYRYHVAAGDLAEALVVAKAATIAYPSSHFFAERLATIAFDVGDMAACRDALDRARRLGSVSRSLLLMEPALLMEEGSVGEAVRLAQALAEADPPDADFLRCAARILARAGSRSAIPAWEKLVVLGQITPSELYEATRFCRLKDDRQAAARFLGRLLAQDPTHPGALQERLRLLAAERTRVDAEFHALARTVIERRPSAAAALLPDFLAGREWPAALALLCQLRNAGCAPDLGAAVLKHLAEAAERAEWKGDFADAATILEILAQGCEKEQATALRARAAAAADAAVASADAALARGDESTARDVFHAGLLIAESGGAATRALARLGERLGLAVDAARCWICIWSASGADADLARAGHAAVMASLRCEGLTQLLAVRGLPMSHPLIARLALATASAANAELAEAGAELSPAAVAAARALLDPGAPPGWPNNGARSYVRSLRLEMKSADKAQDLERAVTLAEAAASIDPRNAHPHKVLARRSIEAGDPLRARHALRRLADLEPHVPDHAVRFARSCGPDAGHREALDVLLPALARNPRHDRTWQMVDQWLCERIQCA